MSLILRLRTWVPAIAAGLVLAVAAGAAYAWRNPANPDSSRSSSWRS